MKKFILNKKKDYNYTNNLRTYEYIKLFIKNFNFIPKK